MVEKRRLSRPRPNGVVAYSGTRVTRCVADVLRIGIALSAQPGPRCKNGPALKKILGLPSKQI